jgi:hypothetical protein
MAPTIETTNHPRATNRIASRGPRSSSPFSCSRPIPIATVIAIDARNVAVSPP